MLKRILRKFNKKKSEPEPLKFSGSGSGSRKILWLRRLRLRLWLRLRIPAFKDENWRYLAMMIFSFKDETNWGYNDV